jgi:hypothetical protein
MTVRSKIVVFAAVTVLVSGAVIRHHLGKTFDPPPRRATNHVTQAQAIAVASGLRLAMRDKDAVTYLERAGLTSGMSMGCSHEWTTFYTLTDGCSLGLQIAPLQARADGAWANGRLNAAFIQSNGSNILSISLRR